MRAVRSLAIFLVLIAVLAAAVYGARLPLASLAARTAMAGAGLESPRARVTQLSLDGIAFADVAAGPPGGEAFMFDAVEADYHWRTLLIDRKIGAVRAGPGVVRLTIAQDGAISLPGVRLAGGDGNGANDGLPFDRLRVADAALLVEAPVGAAKGALSAEFENNAGGRASLTLNTQKLDWGRGAIADAQTEMDVELSADGQVKLAASFLGDVSAPAINARRVAARINAEGGSWREALSGPLSDIVNRFAADAQIEFSAPDTDVLAAQLPEFMSAAPLNALLTGSVTRAKIEGAFRAAMQAGSLSLKFADAQTPVVLSIADGATLRLSAQGDAPLYARREDGRQNASFQFALTGRDVNARGAADFEHHQGRWRAAAPVTIDEFVSGTLSLDGTALGLSANGEGDSVIADIALKSGLRALRVGRLNIDDAPFNGAFRISADLARRTAVIANKDSCLELARVRGRLGEHDMEARLTGVKLCDNGGSLASFTWGDVPAATLAGTLSAAQARLSLGQTHAAGRPPTVKFSADYHSEADRTRISGDIANGAMVLNDALDMASATGRFDFTLDADAMGANAVIDRVTISQHGDAALFAPVIGSGKGTLNGDDARFDYVLATPRGAPLGEGAGTHKMSTASGKTKFSFDRLAFTPEGVQPNQLAPPLKGIIDAAQGDVDGEIRFVWSPDGVSSDAEFTINEVSFGGPTRAITRTSGLNGSIALTNLMPLTTAGLQSVTVGAVDVDALQLKDGAIAFEFPGDDTVSLSRGEFPWFGGALGVYDATASLSGQAKIPLRAENVDLKQVLDYVKVDGLSGEGILSGALPLVIEDGKARIENGLLRSVGGGVVRYTGVAGEQASAAGEQAQIAFDLLRDLQYSELEINVSGPLDGRLDFQMQFKGTGQVNLDNASGRLPVLYSITLDAALLELLQQANLSRDINLQIREGLIGRE